MARDTERPGYPISPWEPAIVVVVFGAAVWLVGEGTTAFMSGALTGLLVFLMRYLEAERAAYQRLEERLARAETAAGIVDEAEAAER